MKLVYATLALLAASSALAQQPQPPLDPAFMQKAIEVLEKNRDVALRAQIMAEVKVDQLVESINKLQARILELEKQAMAKAPQTEMPK